MKIYLVENGKYTQGYYRKYKNAVKAVRELDEQIEHLKYHPSLDKTPYFITEIKTED